MPGDQEKYQHLPIPTYDEAVSSSRPSSSQSFRGPTEVSDDAERQGLLGRDGPPHPSSRRNGNYHAPTVESARSSYESGLTSPALSDDEADDDEAELRRDMEQMEVSDEAQERRAQQRARMRRNFHKRFAILTNTFSNIHLPRIPDGWSLSACFAPLRRFSGTEGQGFDYTIVARVVILLLIASLVYVLLISKIFPSGRVLAGQRFDPNKVRDFLIRHVDASKIHNNLKQVTYDDHLAGTKGDFFLADVIKTHFQSSNLDDVYTEDFEVYLNYPRPDGRSVSIVAPPESKWQATLHEEDVGLSDGLEGPKHQAGVFHGLSKNGTVTAPLIYANFGSRKDFDFLREIEVEVAGTIVLMRQYGTQPDQALKVKAAADAGAVGALIYSDPAEDGYLRGAQAPQGPWRASDSVQRGSVSLMSWIIGDVLTPGWASTPDADRQSEQDNPGLPTIPSLPLSARDGEVLVKALQNQGSKAPDKWQGGLREVSYWTGSKSTSPTVELKNEQDEVRKQPIRNVFGRIQGSEAIVSADAPAMYIGNHRDAWCLGGVDPGTGTAVFLELVRVFGVLMANGWRPRRSIVFASWDGGEYNLAGSTEHVEAHLQQLRSSGIAYLNIDRGVYGKMFRAAGSPIFARALMNALEYIQEPTNNDTSLFKSWDSRGGRLMPLTGRGDYVPFQSLAGVSSLDIGFESDDDAASAAKGYGGRAFPDGSCHDNLKWVETLGDPVFGYQGVLVQILALLVHDISDSALSPLDLRTYAATLSAYGAALADALAAAGHADGAMAAPLAALRTATDLLKSNTEAFMRFDDNWLAMQAVTGATTLGESRDVIAERILRNMRKAQFDTRLLDVPRPDGSPGGALAPQRQGDNAAPVRVGGIPGRAQFKHVVYGPRAWGLEGVDGEAAAVFPGIRDAMDAGDWEGVRAQVAIAADVVRDAAEALVANFTAPA